ncbi:hypothetical protein CWE15_10555 [Aliidiomarina taiwanensis]|uniref:YdhG-like domain-containing protein n=1 Tax=Aliidiomarina taiwanensis TaxID=946228 RepID=A0A432WYR4_9GAMM|nr:DUF1801 domain-containing protein [Aliidiomarina taiwanensis]RUO38934.1 hypothetical protein CWE15_10555 [Aliidiomarina taiwanensis]
MTNKTQPTQVPVSEFISTIENKRRHADTLTALALYKDITGAEPVMWGPSIIGFGTYSYTYKSGRSGSAPAAGFSPGKAHMTFYVGQQFSGAEELFTQLGKHKRSVACLYINKLIDVDLHVLGEIIRRDYTLHRDKNNP